MRQAWARRTVAIGAAPALLLGALLGCSDEDGGPRPATRSTAPGATAPPPEAPSATTTTRGLTGSTTSPAPVPGDPASPATGVPAPAPAPGSVIGVGSLAVGQVAPPLLQPGRGDRIVLEVRAQGGAEPTGSTIAHLVQVIRDASGKTVVVDGIDPLPGGARVWRQRDVVAAAASAAQIESGREQVVLRLLFLRGSFEGGGAVIGAAVAGDVAAVFSDEVRAAAGLLVAPSVVEDAVALHEVGHLLGLVDLVVGSGRGDPEHPGHSRNRRSVMYWQVESNLVGQLLDGGIPRSFDADDRAELAAIRAG